MRTHYTNIETLRADLTAEADGLPYIEDFVTLALPDIAMPPEAVAQIALGNVPGAGDPARVWFTTHRPEGQAIRHTPRGEGVVVQIDYQRDDGPYPLGVLELLRLPGGTCAPAITAHPGSILALLPALRTLADLLPGWNVRAVIDPPAEPARPRDEDAPKLVATYKPPEPAQPRPKTNERGPTVKTRLRAEVFRDIKDKHRHWGYHAVADEAMRAHRELGDGITGETVRNAYKAMGWTWERADRVR